MTSDGPETLTSLVAATLTQEGGPDTVDTLWPRCVDPETGYQPSRTTVWKFASYARAETAKISPKLIRAIAAGLGLNVERVQAAAAYQYTGYVASPLAGGTAVHMPGVDASSLPKSQAIMDAWAEEESQVRGNHSAE